MNQEITLAKRELLLKIENDFKNANYRSYSEWIRLHELKRYLTRDDITKTRLLWLDMDQKLFWHFVHHYHAPKFDYVGYVPLPNSMLPVMVEGPIFPNNNSLPVIKNNPLVVTGSSFFGVIVGYQESRVLYVCSAKTFDEDCNYAMSVCAAALNRHHNYIELLVPNILLTPGSRWFYEFKSPKIQSGFYSSTILEPHTHQTESDVFSAIIHANDMLLHAVNDVMLKDPMPPFGNQSPDLLVVENELPPLTLPENLLTCVSPIQITSAVNNFMDYAVKKTVTKYVRDNIVNQLRMQYSSFNPGQYKEYQEEEDQEERAKWIYFGQTVLESTCSAILQDVHIQMFDSIYANVLQGRRGLEGLVNLFNVQMVEYTNRYVPPSSPAKGYFIENELRFVSERDEIWFVRWARVRDILESSLIRPHDNIFISPKYMLRPEWYLDAQQNDLLKPSECPKTFDYSSMPHISSILAGKKEAVERTIQEITFYLTRQILPPNSVEHVMAYAEISRTVLHVTIPEIGILEAFPKYFRTDLPVSYIKLPPVKEDFEIPKEKKAMKLMLSSEDEDEDDDTDNILE
jgi:hypothetical protein